MSSFASGAQLAKLQTHEHGRCEFREPGPPGWCWRQCENMGIKLRLRDPLGRIVQRTLCQEHSDWIEADENV